MIDPPKSETIHALVMKGGGIKGLAFAGAIEVLEEAGYHFHIFVGTSAGSLAAALLAAGYTPKELQAALKQMDFKKLLDARLVKALCWNLLVRGGMYPGNALSEWVGQLLEAKLGSRGVLEMRRLQPTGRRAVIFASHPKLGTLTYDSEGVRNETPIKHAVRVSSSIPGIFIPKTEGGYRVYDGGLLNNFPVDVYQRVRGPLQPDEHGDLPPEDFIALYIGEEPRKNEKSGVFDAKRAARSKWWVLEALNIMLDRDEETTLETYQDRSIVINTHPIKTADFALGEDEKEYLVETGRHAAHSFLRDSRAKGSQDRVMELLEKVEVARRRRRWATATKAVASVAAMLTIAVGAGYYLWPNGDRYSIPDRPKHIKTYVDYQGGIRYLGPETVKEVLDISRDFPPSFYQNRVRFDSLVQVILTRRDGATKLMLWEGVYDGKHDKTIEIKAQSQGGGLGQVGVVFVQQGGRWIRKEGCEFQRVETSKNLVRSELNPTKCLVKGQSIRLVEFASYEPVFQERAIQWTLYAHRGLEPESGRATYLLLSGAGIDYPHDVYAHVDGPEAVGVIPPQSRTYASSGWERVRELADFVPVILAHPNFSADLKEPLERIGDSMRTAYAGYAEQGLEKAHLLFEVDQSTPVEEHSIAPPNLQELNLMVFAEDKSMDYYECEPQVVSMH